MSLGLRYKGGFYSVAGVTYDVEIYQEGYAGAVSSVAFCEAPVEIEWQEVDKVEPVVSSAATLCLFAGRDRQFTDLYTVEAGSIRMDVYRDGALHWSGTLDPELYEEPFAYLSGYCVELTFADFAILDRMKWDRTGFVTLREVITHIVGQSGIRYGALQEHISTSLPSDAGRLLDLVSVDSANFYNEEGEAMTLREVLDETLRPFALHLVQKGGHCILYDLNALSSEFVPAEVRWDGDDASYSVDKVYNNIEVKFSPYEEFKMLEGNVDSDSVTGGEELTVWIGRHAAMEEKGFTIRLTPNGSGLEKSAAAKYFKIESIHSGSDSAGVAYTVKTMPSKNSGVSGEKHYLNAPTSGTGQMLLRVPRTAYIGNVNSGNYQLRVSMDLLYDVRYNPFEETNEDDKDDNGYKDYDYFKNWANYAYVPVKILLRNEAGSVIYHFENRGVKNSRSFAHPDSTFRWVAGEGTWNDCWMCWYQGNRKNETGLGGWQSNKRIIGYYRGSLPTLFDRRNNGEFIPLPPRAGWIEVQIGTGVEMYDYKSKTEWKMINKDIEHVVHWMLYKNVQVEVVDRYGNSLEKQDETVSAWLNRAAKEELTIDTLLGTMEQPSPVARGQLYRTADRSIITHFARGGQTDKLERLMIGTIYSNYATRHTVLSGTARLLPTFGTLTDINEPGHYLLAAETQRLREEESVITMIAFDADNYEGIAYE